MPRAVTFAAGLVTALAVAVPGAAIAQRQPAGGLVTPQPDPDAAVAPYVVNPAAPPHESRAALIRLLRSKIKYVFVIFNENHSFDNEFGTFPGANGLFSDGHAPRDAAHTLGCNQTYTGADGQKVTIQPFRIGPAQNATFVDSVDHSHTGLAKKLDVQHGVAAMDGFADDEYTRFASKGGAANIAMGTQFARLVMSYIDCDTIPFFWQYANRFALFDNIFATEDTPSTPNAIAMIAGQSGETQWVKHGAAGATVTVNGVTGTLQGVPVVNDPQPYWGSQFDATATDREPHGPALESYANGNISENLTFATMPLLFAGRGIGADMAKDRAPATDLADIRRDIPFIASRKGTPINWRWYEEGYDHEPTDPAGQDTHGGYVSHHNGAQYFGYIANNPALTPNLRGLGDAFADLAANKLPEAGRRVLHPRRLRQHRRADAADPERQLPRPAHRRRPRDHRQDEAGRRRPPVLQRPADQRGDGGARDQRGGRQCRAVEAEPDHHHLRRVRRLLRPRAAGHPAPTARTSCRWRAASASR